MHLNNQTQRSVAKHALQSLIIGALVCGNLAQGQKWTIYKPGNTGIGGNQVEGFRLDPSGRPWVGARYPIQGDGGVARFNGTKWTNYSNIDNLMPSEYVYSMAFAAGGVRWFGTRAGLVQHFGDHFKLYNSSNAPLPKSEIHALELDAGGNVWMVYSEPGFVSTGVARFDGTNWTVWPHTAMGYTNTTDLGKIAIVNGNVWVGSNSPDGMAKWDGSKWSRVKPGAGSVPFYTPYLGKDGRLWVLAGGDVRVLNGNTWETKPLPATDGLYWTALHALADGSYYVGNWQGQLAYRSGSTWQSMNTPAAVMSIETNAAGELWWVSLKRLYKFVSWGSWRVYHSGNTGLTEYFTNSVDFDKTGNLWVGTAGGGAASFDGSIWRGFNPYNDGSEPWDLPTDNVTEVRGATDGTMWIATGNSFAQWNGTNWTQFGYGFAKDDLDLGPDGSVYATWDINTERGYGKLNGTDFARTNLADAPLYAGTPHDVFVDSAGKLFLATETGMFSNETGTWVRTDLSTIAGPSGLYVNCITKAPNGDLWVGTAGGLARRRGNTWKLFTAVNSGLPATNILAVDVRSDGLLAVGAFDGSVWPYHGGAATFDGKVWKAYTYGNSPIQHEQVEDVRFAPSGSLWIVSQSEGIARINLKPGTGDSLSSVVVLPNEVAAGLQAAGAVTLTGPAPEGGRVVALASDSPLVSVAPSVTILQGTTTNTFPIQTSKVAADTTVSISATLAGVTRTASVKLLMSAAGYYGQSGPLTVTAGQAYAVTMSYRNMGSSTWTNGSGFVLASRSPANNKVFGINRLRLNPVISVHPGELGNFMGTAIAPSVPGTYTWKWQPYLTGVGAFGDESPTVTITVVAAG